MAWLHHHIPADKAYSGSMKELKERKGIKVIVALIWDAWDGLLKHTKGQLKG